MTAEDRTWFEVLLENVQRDVKVIAEAHGALAERLDRFEIRLGRIEDRVEQVAIQVAVLERRVDTLDTKLGLLSVDTQHRFKRIEKHLGRKGPPSGKRR